MKKSNIYLTILVIAMLMLFGNDMQAQGLGPIEFEGGDDVNDEAVPIFGHVFLILSLALGALIGYMKLLKN